MTGGSNKHGLVAEYHLAPILHYLEAITPTKHVFVHNDHFDIDSDIVNDDIYRRLAKLAEEMVKLQERLSK